MSVVLEQLRAALAGRYSIERELGSGGMSVVFLAEDLNHRRRVAIKVLNPELGTDIGAARFLREIEIAAQLTHPHILPLHDSGEANGYLFYVMPYVEGESLRNRLNRDRQLPVAQAVEIARQVAGALAYAHSRGIVHRDIKPENILLPAGVAVVADFGIARAITEAGVGHRTQSGVVIGTPAYMSPEQASGERELDGRSDIYSLGCVCYEMLVGELPFTGPTPQVITARKMSQDVPSLRLARDTVPANVEDGIRRALAKAPADRFATAQQFADSLTPSTHEVGTRATTGRRPERLIAFLLLGMLAIGGAAALWGWRRTSAPAPRAATRFTIAPAPGVHLVPEKGTPTVVLSPDGTRLVYLGWDSTHTRLYLRDLDRLDATAIPGTEEALMPFFSPDGKWLGFVSGGVLKKVALSGGPPVNIAPAPQPRGASWSSDGQIILSPTNRSGLVRVPEAGGEPVALTQPRADRGERDHRWADVLPGDVAALFTIWFSNPQQAQIAVASFETGVIKTLFPGVFARYSPSGHIVYLHADGTLLAVPFDIRRLEVTGPSVPILEGVVVKLTGAADFSVSPSGAVAYLAGAPARFELVSLDKKGTLRTLLEGPPNPRSPRFSPDGRRVALTLRQARTDRANGSRPDLDIWVYEMDKATQARLTFEGGDDAIWTVDGRYVTFASDTAGASTLFRSRSDLGGSKERLLDARQVLTPGSWSPDGRVLLFTRTDSATRRDIWAFHSGGAGAPDAFLRTSFNEGAPVVSPDGRWLAYESDESGSYEVYVRSFPTGDRKYPVSTGGGREPRWPAKGRRLFYWGNGKLIEAVVSMTPEFSVRTRRAVVAGIQLGMASARDYDVHPDGERFVFARIETGRQAPELIVVQNWIQELRLRFVR